MSIGLCKYFSYGPAFLPSYTIHHSSSSTSFTRLYLSKLLLSLHACLNLIIDSRLLLFVKMPRYEEDELKHVRGSLHGSVSQPPGRYDSTSRRWIRPSHESVQHDDTSSHAPPAIEPLQSSHKSFEYREGETSDASSTTEYYTESDEDEQYPQPSTKQYKYMPNKLLPPPPVSEVRMIQEATELNNALAEHDYLVRPIHNSIMQAGNKGRFGSHMASGFASYHRVRLDFEGTNAHLLAETNIDYYRENIADSMFIEDFVERFDWHRASLKKKDARVGRIEERFERLKREKKRRATDKGRPAVERERRTGFEREQPRKHERQRRREYEKEPQKKYGREQRRRHERDYKREQKVEDNHERIDEGKGKDKRVEAWVKGLF